MRGSVAGGRVVTALALKSERRSVAVHVVVDRGLLALAVVLLLFIDRSARNNIMIRQTSQSKNGTRELEQIMLLLMISVVRSTICKQNRGRYTIHQ